MEKKILYVLPTLNYGGAELQTINQINFLISKSNDNIFLMILSTQVEAIPGLNLESSKIVICEQNSILNLEKGSINKYIFLIREAVQAIEKYEITDIIAILPLAHFICRMAKIRMMARFKRIKLYTYYRALDFKNPKEFSTSFRMFIPVNSLLARMCDNYSIFNSQACLDNIKNHFFVRKPYIIDNCIPYVEIDETLANQFFSSKEGDLSGSYNILFPGRYVRKKGHIFFLNAVKEFIEENYINPDKFKIIIAGHGPLKQENLIKGAASKISNYVIFTGEINNRLMLSLMKYCDLVVVPSLWEAFGNVAVEGLMQKAVVLTSDGGGLKNIVKHGKSGFQFRAGDRIDLIDKLRIIYIQSLDKSLSKEDIFQRYKENYGINKYFEKFNRLYNFEFKI